MPRPWVIVTGATGFLGSQLVRQLNKEYHVYALGRRSPKEAGAPEGPGIKWFRADIADFERLREIFAAIGERGGARLLLHLAAYYDFSGEDNPEYQRTNVQGTRNILELSLPLKLEQFIFTSSIAALPFPDPGKCVTEETKPSASFAYARSKQEGETLMWEYQDRIPTCIVRPAAIFSDWCEYEPLDAFLRTWCSRSWNSLILGGRGMSAIPYLHVEDFLSFLVRVVEKRNELRPSEVLLASPDGCTSHRELFTAATTSYFGAPRRPLLLPKPLAGLGVSLREHYGRLRRRLPFERSWMIDYIDMQLSVDTAVTQRRIDWGPNPALEVIERLPKLIVNLKTHPEEWSKLREIRGKGGCV
jgi:nucleoside-diphosphate-sugar epimerase